MPDFLTEEQSELRQQAESLAQQISEMEMDSSDPKKIQLQIREKSKAAGIFHLTQPIEYGGLGGTAIELTIARESLAIKNVGHLPGIFGPNPGLLSRASKECTHFCLS